MVLKLKIRTGVLQIFKWFIGFHLFNQVLQNISNNFKNLTINLTIDDRQHLKNFEGIACCTVNYSNLHSVGFLHFVDSALQRKQT